MPDTPPPAPAPRGRAPRGQIDKDILAELDLAENLLNTAEKEEYLPALAAEEGIDAPFCAQLRTELQAARALATAAVQSSAKKTGTTGAETQLKKNLVALLRQIQAKARRKHGTKNRALLKPYGVGGKIDHSRPALVQTAHDILEQLAKDPLPGVTPAKIEAIEAALKAYEKVETTQSGDQGDATGARGSLARKMEAIAEKRRQIQFAADAQWPPDNRAHAGIRREFKLSPTKAFHG